MARPQRLNVLVVDRDPGTLLELKDFLSEEGYQVESLSEPDRVVEEVKDGRFQLILLDVSPPLDPGVQRILSEYFDRPASLIGPVAYHLAPFRFQGESPSPRDHLFDE